VLGYGDEYFASDKDGKVANKNTDVNLDLRDKTSASHQQSTNGGTRRKQHTRSLTDLPSDEDITCRPLSPSRLPPEPTEGPLSRTRSLPKRRNTLRPLSMIVPAVTPDRNSLSGLDFRRTAYDREQKQRSTPAAPSVPQISSASFGNSVTKYVDAAVQTELLSPTTMAPNPPPLAAPTYVRTEMEVSQGATFPHPHYSITLDRYSSIYPYHTPHQLLPLPLPPPVTANPVIIGKMQTYFRTEKYRLGDALRRSCELLR
jgi:hypothetical protein